MRFTATITRHGETVANTSGIAQGGRTNTALTEKGLRQAASLAEHPDFQGVTRFYTADNERSFTTALPTVERLRTQTGLPVPVLRVPDLNEVDFGQYDGGPSRGEFDRSRHRVYLDGATFEGGGESLAAAGARLRRGFATIGRDCGDGARVGVVSSGTILRLIPGWCFGLLPEELLGVSTPNAIPFRAVFELAGETDVRVVDCTLPDFVLRRAVRGALGARTIRLIAAPTHDDPEGQRSVASNTLAQAAGPIRLIVTGSAHRHARAAAQLTRAYTFARSEEVAQVRHPGLDDASDATHLRDCIGWIAARCADGDAAVVVADPQVLQQISPTIRVAEDGAWNSAA